jgi:hypothetical protein
MPELSLAVRTTLARDGVELPSLEAAKRHAVEAAFAVLAKDIERGKINLDRHIDLEDSSGRVVFTVRFCDLVEPQGPPN